MPTHVALLRGINVGGRNKVAMADLREVVASLGHRDVATYIQSGNVVFTAGTDTGTADSASDGLATALEARIAERLGVRPRVVVLSRAELAQVVADNPYPGETDPKRLHAMFGSRPLEPAEVAAVAAAQQRAQRGGSRDEACVLGRTVYLRTPEGLGRSELAAQLTRQAAGKSGGTAATARNWATVTRLLALLEA